MRRILSVFAAGTMIGLGVQAMGGIGFDTGACCTPIGTCSVTPDFACLGTYLGDGTTCTPGVCDAVTDGACCLGDGTCVIDNQFSCSLLGGTFHGVGSACESVDCTGACCFGDGSCTETGPVSCAVAGGNFGGVGLECGEVTCTGACCRGDGTCVETGPVACTDAGGTFHGLESVCEEADCTGACCEGDGVCSEVGPEACSDIGGSFFGLATSCDDVSCIGACCLPTGACSDLSSDSCTDAGGSFSGLGSSCAEEICPVPSPITYQGRLDLGGNPYTGEIDLEFRLMNSATGGSQIGSTVHKFDVAVENGLFMSLIDFGPEVFTGTPLWLEITVVTDTEIEALSPRQLLTSVPYAVQTRGLFVDELLNVGVGTTSPDAMLHVRGNGDFRGQHVAYFESLGNDGDGIAIQLNNAHTNSDNNYITFYDGDGNVTGRIEGFDLENGDWIVPPPIPSLDFSVDFDPGAFPIPNFTPGSLPTVNFSPGSLPSVALSTTSVVGVSVITGVSFSPGSLPSLSFVGGSLPSLSFSGGEAPSVSGIEFELPTLQELSDLMCWAKNYDLEEFVTLDPVSLAAESLKAAATQVCLDEGIVYGSKGADYAEWLPKADAADRFQLGQLVGVTGGVVSVETDGAERIMAVSHAPVVLGNAPPAGEEDGFVKVAFMGQVKVVVRGVVEVGDYIVPSGLNDGTGVAVSPEELTVEQLDQVLGRAWSDSENEVYGLINVLVGMGQDASVEVAKRQHETIRALESQNQDIEDRLARIEALIGSSR